MYSAPKLRCKLRSKTSPGLWFLCASEIGEIRTAQVSALTALFWQSVFDRTGHILWVVSPHIKTQIFKELTGSFGITGLFAKASAGNRVTQKMFPGGNFLGENSMSSMHFAFDGGTTVSQRLKYVSPPPPAPVCILILQMTWEKETLQGALGVYNLLRVRKAFYF